MSAAVPSADTRREESSSSSNALPGNTTSVYDAQRADDAKHVVSELRNTRPTRLARYVAEAPGLFLAAIATVCLAVAAPAFIWPPKIDTDLQNLTIRDHPLSRDNDILATLTSEADTFWRTPPATSTISSPRGLLAQRPAPSVRRFLTDPVDNAYKRSRPFGRRRTRKLSQDNYNPQHYRTVIKWTLHVVYHRAGPDSNMLEPSVIAKMRAVENDLMALPTYPRLCINTYSNMCSRPVSFVNYVYGTLLSDGTFMADASSNEPSDPVVVARVMAAYNFTWLFGDDVNYVAGTTSTLRSEVLFGAPADGFPAGDVAGSRALYESLCADMFDVFSRHQDDDFKINFGGEVMTTWEIKRTLLHDGTYATASCAIAIVMLIIATRSVFLTAAGTFQILVAFPIAYTLYASRGYSYLGIIQFLAPFLILGIGLDDVMVFVGTYRLIMRHKQRFSIATRLQLAFNRSGQAMLATSATSAVAFASNVISPVPAVAVFAILLALLVTVNFVLAVTLTPVCVVCWDRYLADGCYGRAPVKLLPDEEELRDSDCEDESAQCVAEGQSRDGTDSPGELDMRQTRDQAQPAPLPPPLLDALSDASPSDVHRDGLTSAAPATSCASREPIDALQSAASTPSGSAPTSLPAAPHTARSAAAGPADGSANVKDGVHESELGDKWRANFVGVPFGGVRNSGGRTSRLWAWLKGGVDARAVWGRVFDAIWRGRIGCVFLCLGIASAGAYFASRLQTADTVPALFPPHTNVQFFLDLWYNNFSSSSVFDCSQCLNPIILIAPASPAAPPAPALPLPGASPGPAAPFSPGPAPDFLLFDPPASPPLLAVPPPPPQQPPPPTLSFPTQPQPSPQVMAPPQLGGPGPAAQPPPLPPKQEINATSPINTIPVNASAIKDTSVKDNTIKADLVWGTLGYYDTNSSPDPFSPLSGIVVEFDPSFNLSSRAQQLAIKNVVGELFDASGQSKRPDLASKLLSNVLDDFQAWCAQSPSCHSDRVSELPVGPAFHQQLWAFLQTQDSSSSETAWRRGIGYDTSALPSYANTTAAPTARWLHITVATVTTSVAPTSDIIDAYNGWQRWASSVRDATGNNAHLRVAGTGWEVAITEEAIVRSIAYSLVWSTCCALLTVLVFTGSLIVTGIAMLTLISINIFMLGFYHILGWKLGAVEGISITVLMGISVDFCIHLSDAFVHSRRELRKERARDALQWMGGPIVASALSTLTVALPLVFTTTIVLKRFATIIGTSMSMSLFFTLLLNLPLLAMFGPGRRDRSAKGGCLHAALVLWLDSTANRAAICCVLLLFLLPAVPNGWKIFERESWLPITMAVIVALPFVRMALRRLGWWPAAKASRS